MNGLVFVDLAACGEKGLSDQCDVCVIGAGAAGIYLAVELVARGMDVILLEAGNKSGADASAIGFDSRFDAELYPGATEGRSFGLGGSTSRWGGLLIPHTLHDLRRSDEGDFDPWQHIVQAVSDNTASVLAKLGWRNGNDFSEFAAERLSESGDALHAAGLDVAAGLFLPFRKKNLVWLLGRKPGNGSRLRIIYNAVVNGWRAVPDASGARIQQAQAVSSNGKRLAVTAKRFIVAAGAIESARLLLELDQSSPRLVIRKSSATGCYLADHLSVPIADVTPSSSQVAIRLFAPRFSMGWMRSFRFLESNPPTDAPRAFSHFIFDNQNSGFALAKEMLGAMQGRRRPSISAKEFISGIGGLAQLGYKRYGRSALYIPPDTKTHLQLDIEQVPLRENGITLGDELDRYGRRIAKIHWRIDERDLENLRITAKRILEKWAGGRFPLPQLLPRLDDCTATKPHDAYHPVGTCRLGRDREAVVDENLKVWGLENLWVVSTGVLPSAGTANPTFTMVCLADRLAEQLADNRRALN
jgi:choline dehydrogenase-like flavoprotein